ncbi:crotonobetainyl-CoA:carnitine CoA-transferase CaiB-like acyl-CoA transferase [Antricoccus suffuscus]|uniref:Crotonobetainyl-CoA:carnitine CoA-transferase CaiB-like acyl-CoA transferase n=1 Tax=Antricoccus suffuscus TaxID=1629062 RepID=A0A2T1A2W0_9ACTN|nr:CoA transferase [Antricoccus suffuscus]PRZ42817.1 crotonobetainyl-CoA:carnitine CoA-transferase CaiB-like acyl-CoA transferase [Antricoccus suffuscus]
MSETATEKGTYLGGLKVLEIANELGEYAGKLLAGLGADVVKVEPIGGEMTRGYGPFYRDEPDPDHSLYFWHYNVAKRSVTLDLDSPEGQREFEVLAQHADVLIDSRPGSYLADRGLGYEALSGANPGLIYLRITPFGEDGPWADFQGSDLVHLALGGMAMNSGYDPEPDGHYDTPPIAPQMWQAYHVAGEQGVIAVMAALLYRGARGQGQYLSCAVHQANAVNTELDLPNWLTLRRPHRRQTGRHSSPVTTPKALTQTKDGRYLLPYVTYVRNFPSSWSGDIAALRKYGMQGELDDPEWEDPDFRAQRREHIASVMDRLVRRFTYDSDFWREMIGRGLPWAPVRTPEENLADEHWKARDSFAEVQYPEVGEGFVDVGARWVCDQVDWVVGPRAPLVGEHNGTIVEEWTASRDVGSGAANPERAAATSPYGKPFALAGLRVVDLSWMLASAGAGKFLAAFGADVIKVEHESRLDGMRFTEVVYPPGGPAERDAARAPMTPTPLDTFNKSANFMEINTGKSAISLNLKDPRGKQILEDLIRDADVVIEGYSPGTMKRMGLGYDRLKELNPDVVYVQQSGLGERGTYDRAKAFGPTAQAFSGLTDMSGFPAPWPPAGIGYSYLDWFGAYNAATAILAGLYRRDQTGRGCHIDASQVETGMYLAGTAILDYTANGRTWSRRGNRSPDKPAAPHGIYRADGDDRWIAIACFTQSQWVATAEVLGHPQWVDDERFATLEQRLAHQDELDALVGAETATRERYELMGALQASGVPAGVAQNAEDRVDNDPQLRHREWLVKLKQTENGVWPVKQLPVQMSATPPHVGGVKQRNGPNYGEDTAEVLTRILGLSDVEVKALFEEGVV